MTSEDAIRIHHWNDDEHERVKEKLAHQISLSCQLVQKVVHKYWRGSVTCSLPRQQYHFIAIWKFDRPVQIEERFWANSTLQRKSRLILWACLVTCIQIAFRSYGEHFYATPFKCIDQQFSVKVYLFIYFGFLLNSVQLFEVVMITVWW